MKSHKRKTKDPDDAHKVIKVIRRRPEQQLNQLFQSKGYVIGNIDCITNDPNKQNMLLGFIDKAKKSLKTDLTDKTGLRNRAMGKFLITPYTKELVVIDRLETDFGDAVTPYYQSGEYNKDVSSTGKNVRYFPAISEETLQDATLQRLVRFAYNKAIAVGCISKEDLVTSNIQFVQQRVSGNHEMSYTSPAVLHVDGEPFTAIFVIERTENTIGGENFVAQRDQQGKTPDKADTGTILSEVVLKDPFDFLMVNDYVVSHHVNGISSSDNRVASRTTILIDFSPWRQQLTPQGGNTPYLVEGVSEPAPAHDK